MKKINFTNDGQDDSISEWMNDMGMSVSSAMSMDNGMAQEKDDNDSLTEEERYELNNPQLKIQKLRPTPTTPVEAEPVIEEVPSFESISNQQMIPEDINAVIAGLDEYINDQRAKLDAIGSSDNITSEGEFQMDQTPQSQDMYQMANQMFQNMPTNVQSTLNMTPQQNQAPIQEDPSVTTITTEQHIVQQQAIVTPTSNGSQYINKENFTKFVNSLNIIKNLKQNVIFENGATHFVSDSKSYICKFNIHCPEISFKIPFVEQQAVQLSFLTKSDAVSMIESEDDYTFSNNQFKFQLRKTISDNNTWNADIYTRYYNDIVSKPLVAQYEFTDQDHLNSFLSIIKGVKRGNLGFASNQTGTELVISRGDVNSGKFELLKIPCNLNATNNQIIDSVFDSVAMLYDYLNLKLQFYYNAEADYIFIIISGTLAGGYDIEFISTAYRSYLDKVTEQAE